MAGKQEHDDPLHEEPGEDELQPKPRRSRTKVDPDQKKAELEEAGEYVSPIREGEPTVGPPSETYPAPVEEPPPLSDKDLIIIQEEAQRIFNEDRAAQQIGPGPAKATLHQKLIEVMAAIDAVEKQGENTNQNYKYQRAVDVFRAVRPEFIKHGLLFLTEVLGTHTTLIERGSGRGPNVLVEIECLFKVSDGVESLEFPGAGAGIDASGDKSVYKAITGAMKYGIRQLLMIPDENDPERPRAGEREDVEGSGPITITPKEVTGVSQGGRQAQATEAQVESIRQSANQLGLSPATLKAMISSTLGVSPDGESAGEILDWLSHLSFAECGKVAKALWERRQETPDAEDDKE